MEPILQVTNLKKTYKSPEGEQTTVVDIPAFTINEGQQIAIQGGSGSGKTTFLNMVAGILRPDTGTIHVAGQELSNQPESRRDRIRATTIGYVFQTFNLLLGFTALENVEMGMMFGNGPNRKRALNLLHRMGLTAHASYLPRQLSVGQQQRVAVARALANNPRLVLADEPTGNLDRARALEALKLIREVCTENGSALLLVSHDQEILQQFENRQDFAQLNHAAAAHSTAGAQS